MAPQAKLQAVAFISPQNHPILVRTFLSKKDRDLKYHYLAHTSLDVFEERTAAASSTKSTECYLGLLFVMDEAAIYGYITPLKVKIVIMLSLTDAVVRDADVTTMFRAFHMAYYHSLSNPFLRLDPSSDAVNDHCALLTQSNQSQGATKRWKGFRQRVDDVARAAGAVFTTTEEDF